MSLAPDLIISNITESYKCDICGESFDEHNEAFQHISTKHRDQVTK